MSINELHELTGKLIAEGRGKLGVTIGKDTFTHPLERDGAVIMPVESAEVRNYEILDDDGGMTDEHSTSLVLFGNEPWKPTAI